MTKYIIEITPLMEEKFCSTKPYMTTIETDDIKWSMEQYQRNRKPFSWKIVNEE